MDYGGIFTDTFRFLWKEKRLWAIAALGTLMYGLVSFLYMLGIAGWQGSWMNSLMEMGSRFDEEAFFDMMMNYLSGMLALMFVGGLFGLAGYVVNLITRAGFVAEAGKALRGESVDITRGLSRGLRKAPAFFVLDLIWRLPVFLLLFVGAVLLFLMLGGLFVELAAEGLGDGALIGGMIGLIFTLTGVGLCVGLLYALFRGIFAPLMYQASAQDDRPIGQAISEGWRLARANLGPMVVFLLMIWAIQLGLNVLVRLVALPFSFMFMTPWENMITSLEQGFLTGPSAGDWFLMFIAALGSSVMTWLWLGVSQSVYLAFYARVYRALKEAPTTESVTPAPTTPPAHAD
jgi:hypothetical protein